MEALDAELDLLGPGANGLTAYARRMPMTAECARNRTRTFATIRTTMDRLTVACSPADQRILRNLVDLDEALCRPSSEFESRDVTFDFDARKVLSLLQAMELPSRELLLCKRTQHAQVTFWPWGKHGVTPMIAWDPAATVKYT